MKRKIITILLMLTVLFAFAACGQDAAVSDQKAAEAANTAENTAEAANAAENTANDASGANTGEVKEPAKELEKEPEVVLSWEDLYKEGMSYFEDESYKEAIAAFTKSIGIDPEHAPVYIRRGDSYVFLEVSSSEEAEKNLDLAWDDYEKASEIDKAEAGAYLGMADVLIRRESFEEAYTLLKSAGGSVADTSAVSEKIEEIESGKYLDSSKQIRRLDQFDTAGHLVAYRINEYDYLGRRCGWRNYEGTEKDPSAIQLSHYCVVTFDENGLAVRNDYLRPDGSQTSYQTMEYDERGLEVRRNVYTSDDVYRAYYLTYYDEEGKETGYDSYYADGTMFSYWRYDYDENGNLVQQNEYDPSGKLLSVTKPSED